MTRRWAPLTRYTLRRISASIMKDLINFILRSQVLVYILRHLNDQLQQLRMFSDDPYSTARI